MELSQVTRDLLTEVETLLEEGYTKEQVWEQLQSNTCTDTELDSLVGLLEDNGHKQLATEISLGIHTPTLQMDLEKSLEWGENRVCSPANWQKPKGDNNDR